MPISKLKRMLTKMPIQRSDDFIDGLQTAYKIVYKRKERAVLTDYIGGLLMRVGGFRGSD